MNSRKWLNYENGLLLLLGFTFGLAFFDRNAVNFLTPYLVPDLHLSNTQIGMLGSGLSLTWALSAYFVGSWSDRVGARKIFLIGIVLIFSACSMLSGLATSFVPLLLTRLLMGAAEGPFLPICLAIMMAASTVTRRGMNAGIMQTAFGALLGSAVAPLVLIPLAEHFGWRTAFFLAGVPGIFCALMIARWVREPKIVATPAEVAAATLVPVDEAPGFFAMIRVRNIALCCAITSFMVAWYLINNIFLPVFLVDVRHFSAIEMGRLMSVLGLCGALFGFVAPAVSDRIGRRPVLVLLCLMSAICPLAALYYEGPVLGLAALMFIGWVGTGAFPLFMGVVPAESLTLRRAATSMGLVVCVGEIIGGFGAPTIAGWIADQTSLAAPIGIAGGCTVAAGLLSLFLRETAPAVLLRAQARKSLE